LNKTTLDFISEHWHLLLKKEATEFAALIERSPLASVAEIMQELRDGPLSLQELSDRARIHQNTIATITRALEGKLFSSIGVKQQRVISLLPKLSTEKPDEKQSSVPKLLPSPSQKLIFKAVLPPQSLYRPVESPSKGRWLWVDKESKALMIQSQVPNPWEGGKEWAILTGIRNQKGDRSEWPYEARLVLFPLEDNPSAIPALLVRERIKGVFAWASYSNLSVFAFPVESKIWIMYSFLPQNS
jgi:hypothetical protein